MGKAKGKHVEKALTTLKINKLSVEGRYPDGNGLYLVVSSSGSKRWILRIMVDGKRKDIGLGGWRDVTLAMARDETQKMRRQVRDGLDPVIERRKSKKKVVTFDECMRAVHAANVPTWSPKYAMQWLNIVSKHASPKLGSRSMEGITSADIVAVLSPIWVEKAETARRVKQRLSVIFDWARVNLDEYDNANPVAGVKQGLPKVTYEVTHFRSMDYQAIPEFLTILKASSQSINVKLALEFTILTAARSGEVRGAKWSEIDLENALWTRPKERMKNKKEHKVPLTERCLEILQEIKPISGKSELVFPSSINWTKQMSDMTLTKALRRLGHSCTIHGFRSSFRNWTAEQTSYPRDVCEMALAHSLKDKVEAAYKRTDLLEKRRLLMNDWAGYLIEK